MPLPLEQLIGQLHQAQIQPPKREHYLIEFNHYYCRSGFNFGRSGGCPISGRYAAAKKTNPIQWCLRLDFGKRDFKTNYSNEIIALHMQVIPVYSEKVLVPM